MIPIRNRKKTLQVTVEEMRNFAFAYVDKYAPSKQQLKTYLLKPTTLLLLATVTVASTPSLMQQLSQCWPCNIQYTSIKSSQLLTL